MSRFSDWVIAKLGYLPRPIDLACNLNQSRGELVRKWYAGEAYPNESNCEMLGKYLKLPHAEVRKAVLLMKIEDLNGTL